LLVGHANNVCAIDVSADGSYLVSGGWDGKSIVWSTQKWDSAMSLKHNDDTKSVWAVLSYSTDIVITGCADTYIRIFHIPSVQSEGYPTVAAKRALKTDDVVRALCRFPVGGPRHSTGADFASAGNDSVIRLWKIDGTQVGSLFGHESFIYSLASLPTGELVSSGEDRTVRIWRENMCIQTITLPAISVWQVAVCRENGDIATATSDHVVRIFTRSPERAAAPGAISDFENAIRQSTVKGSKVDRKDLKTKEWLATAKGMKTNQVVMVLEDDESISAYQWAGDTWELLGTVVDSEEAAKKREKVVYQGKEYDYVFDVDTEDGKPPHKLPYNLGEDTYTAATRFLNDNDLPISYLEAVAAFIRENTAEAQKATSNAPAVSSPPPEATPRISHLPHTEYLSIAQAKLEPALRKLGQYNQDHIAAGNKHIALNPDSLKRLEGLVQALSGGAEPKLSNDSIKSVIGVLACWPYSNRLPALDIYRCMAAGPALASFPEQQYGNAVVVALRSAIDPSELDMSGREGFPDLALDKVEWDHVNVNNLMMALRATANLFITSVGRAVVAKEAGRVIPFIGRIVGIDGQAQPVSANLNLQLALVTTTFNYACLAYNERQGSSQSRAVKPELLSQLVKIGTAVTQQSKDAEVLYRAVMAIGMILASGKEGASLVSRQELDRVFTQTPGAQEPRIQGVWLDCQDILRG